MSESVKAVAGSAAVAPPERATRQASASPASAAVPQDRVRLSESARALLQEATETPAQTAKEAAHGDGAARRLAAREAAEVAATKTESKV